VGLMLLWELCQSLSPESVGGEEASRQTYFQQHQAETRSVSINSIMALREYESN
jgi:hypothetical protein